MISSGDVSRPGQVRFMRAEGCFVCDLRSEGARRGTNSRVSWQGTGQVDAAIRWALSGVLRA